MTVLEICLVTLLLFQGRGPTIEGYAGHPQIQTKLNLCKMSALNGSGVRQWQGGLNSLYTPLTEDRDLEAKL